MLVETMYSAEDYGLGEDCAEDCEHGDAVVIKRGLIFCQTFKEIKSCWLNNMAEILHHCDGCSQLMGPIFITNHSTVARYSNQIEVPASGSLNVPQIRPAGGSQALISHSGPAEPSEPWPCLVDTP